MLRILVVLVVSIGCIHGSVFYQPDHVHLAMGEHPGEMVVTWSTKEDTGMSLVEYGIGKMDMQATGSVVKFTDGGQEKRSQFIHKVLLTDLAADTVYRYHCGSELGWSPAFYFKTFPDGDDWIPHLAIFGDLGNVGGASFPSLQREAQAGVYDAMIFVGDFAYDLHTNEGETGDQFMRQLESVAAYLPFMVTPGNHEEKYNFSHYRSRFNMPGDTENLYFSFNIGPVHFISFSSESYYFPDYLTPERQFAWLQKDLMEANKPENRAKQPWIITMAHRPMYCTTLDSDECSDRDVPIRVGMRGTNKFALEPLFFKYGVDVAFWGHQHFYERLWPMYDYTMYKGSEAAPYVNPGAPIHIISGSAGCEEGHVEFGPAPEWLAFRAQDNGYTRFRAYNASHLYMEQLSVDQKKIIDRFWIEKHRV